MRRAKIYVHGVLAGFLKEEEGRSEVEYLSSYVGKPISLTLPFQKEAYIFKYFPPFFEGLLPEGPLLEALLRNYKLDKRDYLRQLMVVGHDLVGSVTVEEDK